MATRTPPTPEELLEAFGATPADLELNRQGRVGPGQMRRLRRMALVNALIVVGLVAVLLVAMLAVAAHPIQWWRWLLVAVLAAILLAIGARWIRKLLLSEHDPVDCHTGPVHVFIAGSSGKQLRVKEITYNLTVPLGRVVDGATYEVYVVERTAMVVAMVPLDGATS